MQRLNLLRKYVPDKLFAESDLPQVRIYVNAGGYHRPAGTQRYIVEDASLVLSSAGYLPGKPTFRVPTGILIPLNNDNVNSNYRDITTEVDNYYICSSIPAKIQPTVGLHLIPEELISAQNLFNIVTIELCSRLSEVRTVELLCNPSQSSGVGYQYFFFWGNTRAHVPVSRLQWPFYAYLPSSNSYGRHFIFPRQWQRDPDRQMMFKSIPLYIYTTVDVHYFVYAVDVDARLRGRYCNQNGGRCGDRDIKVPINQGQQCLAVPHGRTYSSQFVKLFVRPSGDNQLVAKSIGYEIRKSTLLEFNMYDIFDQGSYVIEQLLSSIGKVASRTQSLAEEFRVLSLHTAILNAIRHFLSHDLVLSYYFSKLQFIKLEKFINLSILIHDVLFKRSLISGILAQNNTSDVVNILVNEIVDKNEKILLKNPMGVLLKHLISTTHRYKVETFKSGLPVDKNDRSIYYDKIRQRLNNLLKQYEKGNVKWYKVVLLETLRHTYHHHMIKSISVEAKVSPEKMLEGFVELYRGKGGDIIKNLPIMIFERESGSLGFLERVADNMAKNKYTGFRRLILTFGQCLVGTPEDVLHFLLARGKDLCSESKRSGLKKVISDIADFAGGELKIILTPEELEEAVRLWYSIRAEAERLTEVLPDKPAEAACVLLREIHEARYKLEREINRFPELDELIVYLLLNMKRGSVLREIVKQLLRRSLEAAGHDSSLSKEYRQDYLDKFIEDIKNVLKSGCQGQVVSVICKKRQGGSFSADISYALKALGRIMRGILLRLALLTCNSACGYCYVNTKSCSRYSAPFIQAKTLDRRVAKILVSDFIKLKSKPVNDYYDPDELDKKDNDEYIIVKLDKDVIYHLEVT